MKGLIFNQRDIHMTKNVPIRRIYKKAPILEAVIDFRLNTTITTDFHQFQENFRHAISDDYHFDSVHDEYEFKINESVVSEKIHPIKTLRFKSQDKNIIVQARLDGFSISKLAPYDRWETFVEEAKKLFIVYNRIATIKTILRIAVRFINRFDLPGPSVELANYLNIFPHFPQSDHLSGLAMQVILRHDQPDTTLVIREALAPPSKPGVISILLDLDLFHEKEHSYSDNIWAILESLHTRKNEAFENAITDKMRGLIS